MKQSHPYGEMQVMVCRLSMRGLNVYQLYADEHSKEGNQLHVEGKQQSALMNNDDGFMLIERSHWIWGSKVEQIGAPPMQLVTLFKKHYSNAIMKDSCILDVAKRSTNYCTNGLSLLNGNDSSPLVDNEQLWVTMDFEAHQNVSVWVISLLMWSSWWNWTCGASFWLSKHTFSHEQLQGPARSAGYTMVTDCFWDVTLYCPARF